MTLLIAIMIPKVVNGLSAEALEERQLLTKGPRHSFFSPCVKWRGNTPTETNGTPPGGSQQFGLRISQSDGHVGPEYSARMALWPKVYGSGGTLTEEPILPGFLEV